MSMGQLAHSNQQYYIQCMNKGVDHEVFNNFCLFGEKQRENPL